MSPLQSGFAGFGRPWDAIFRVLFSCGVLVLYFILLPTSEALPATVTLAWDPPSPSTGVTGYRLYYGVSSGQYTTVIDVGNVTSRQVSNLSQGTTYYFAATAYGSNRNESGFSNEVSYTVPSAANTTYTISSSAAANGSISPSGSVTVSSGASQSFTITPNTGYKVASLTVDGSPVTPASSYAFSNVTANHSISATFTRTTSSTITYTISSSAGANGSISPSGSVTVSSGASQSFTITPNTGYKIASLTVDGSPVTPATSYAFSNVTANHSISATFTRTTSSTITYTITSSTGANGSISPSGSVTVSNGASQSFTITPNTGYKVASLTVDGSPVTPATSYAFSNVTANHSIRATFTAATVPKITSSHTAYDYDYTEVNIQSVFALTISNRGQANLNIGASALSGINTDQFSVLSDACSNRSLSASRSCAMQIAFSPSSLGSKSATLSIPSNDPSLPTLSIPLTGVGSPPPARIAIFRAGQWFFDLNGNEQWDGCDEDLCYSAFGSAQDLPVLGDWTGSGVAKIGVFRSGAWYLDRNGNGSWNGCGTSSRRDICYESFGVAGDVPVVGDWTGDGKAKIGVFRNGPWYLDRNGNGVWDGCGTTDSSDICVTNFGRSGDLPVVGDWNGDGKAKIGFFRNGTWYLDWNGNGVWDGCGTPLSKDVCITGFGLPGDRPVVGDWRGDRIDKIGVFRNGSWYLDRNGNGSWDGCEADSCVDAFGMSTDLPVAGILNP